MINPYQSSNLPEAKTARGKKLSLKVVIATLLLLTGPVAVAMAGLSDKLREARIINTRDLAPLAGNETGTLSEVLLNVWHWDAAIVLLMIATIPNTIIGSILLISGRRSESTE